MTRDPEPSFGSGWIGADTQFLQAANEAVSGFEGRDYPRFPYQNRIRATILPLDGVEGEPIAACDMLTRDLSRGGINLIHSEALESQQQLLIELNGLSRCVEVVWCRRLSHRCFSIGCKFVARRSGPTRSLSDPRHPYQAQIEATILPPAEAASQPPVQCTMSTRDLSRGGINLLHTNQLLPGQRIVIFLKALRRHVQAVVMWCQQLAHQCYAAGCRFIAGKRQTGDFRNKGEEV